MSQTRLMVGGVRFDFEGAMDYYRPGDEARLFGLKVEGMSFRVSVSRFQGKKVGVEVSEYQDPEEHVLGLEDRISDRAVVTESGIVTFGMIKGTKTDPFVISEKGSCLFISKQEVGEVITFEVALVSKKFEGKRREALCFGLYVGEEERNLVIID